MHRKPNFLLALSVIIWPHPHYFSAIIFLFLFPADSAPQVFFRNQNLHTFARSSQPLSAGLHCYLSPNALFEKPNSFWFFWFERALIFLSHLGRTGIEFDWSAFFVGEEKWRIWTEDERGDETQRSHKNSRARKIPRIRQGTLFHNVILSSRCFQGHKASLLRHFSTTRGLFLESPETFGPEYFGYHNSLYIFARPRF